ncbi:MAG: ribosome recycling factor, partial [Candidatus Dormibacteraceae bacterium]
MNIEEAGDSLPAAEASMKRCIEHFQRELASVRTGRANPDLVEHLSIDYYGAPTPLNQLAQISIPEARLIVIQPYDRSQMGAVERAIRASELGLNPANDGEVIRIPIPPLNEERRKQFVRLVKQRAEEARVAIRNVRREALHHLHQGE